ncbi:MAG: tetratricopeptide repeat protein [Oligoflexales bacterium]
MIIQLSNAILVILMTWSLCAHASDYSSGYSKYIRGDFAGAEADFRKAAATSSSTRKARALKMLGISHYMQGERTAAEQSFKQAKSLDPNIRIAPSEVLDESVLSFFNGVRSPQTPQTKPSQPSLRPTTIVQTPERIPTYIRIISNVRTARFLINGQPMGLVNKPTRIRPGVVQVEVTAPGYQRYVGPHRIKPGSDNAVRVTLLKISTATPLNTPKQVVKAVKQRQKIKPKIKPQQKNIKDLKRRKPKRRIIQKNIRTTVSKKTPSVHPLIHFLPLGMNHFIQNQNTFGAVFGISQASFLVYSFIKNTEGNQVTEETDNTISERNNEFSRMTDQNARAEHQQETNDFYNQRLNYINAIYQESNISAGIFILTWGASSAYSYLKHEEKNKHTAIWIQPTTSHVIALHTQWEF